MLRGDVLNVDINVGEDRSEKEFGSETIISCYWQIGR